MSEFEKSNIENVLPLTPLQAGMLYHDLLERDKTLGKTSYCQQLTFRLNGPLDRRAFELSWQYLIDRHAVFRTIFRHDKTAEPIQIILRKRKFHVGYLDLTALNKDLRKRDVNRLTEEDRAISFDLERDIPIRITLLKYNDDGLRHWVLWSFHHIAIDGWCVGQLQQELYLLYESFLSQRPVSLPAPISMTHYVEWYRRQDKYLGYWQQQLQGLKRISSVPLIPYRLNATAKVNVYETINLTISGENFDALLNIGEQTGATLSTLVHALWGIYLAKVNDSDDVIFGSVQSTRPMAKGQFDNLIALCINTLPCRIQLRGDDSFITIAERTQQQLLQNINHGTVAIGEIQAQCPAVKTLFDHFIAFENYPNHSQNSDHTEHVTEDLYADSMSAYLPTSYRFHLAVFPGECLTIAFKYNPQEILADNVREVANCFIKLSEEIIRSPQKFINKIPLVNLATKNYIENYSLGKSTEIKHDSLFDFYQANTESVAGHVAIVDGKVRLSHKQLAIASLRLAEQLKYQHNNRPIALFGFAGAEMFIACLACFKLGLPYIPIAPNYSVQHIQDIFEAAKPYLILSRTDESKSTILDEIVETNDVHILGVDVGGSCHPEPSSESASLHNKIDVQRKPNRESQAYIIFTSGTTGKPKGVPISHGALLNYISWCEAEFGLSKSDIGLLLTSFHFDLGHTTVYGSLLLGGTLHIASEAQRRDPDWVKAYLLKNPISFLKITPSYLRLLIHADSTGRPFSSSQLKTLILGGEELDYGDIENLQQVNPDLNVYNHYGPTENTVGCIAKKLTAKDLSIRHQIIGSPAINVQAYICDRNMALLPPYVEGDLHLSGAQLCEAYLGEHCKASSFKESKTLGDTILYKTGDRAYWNSDGHMIFVGRTDHICKIDGYRIDLKGIEQELITHVGIKECRVCSIQNEDGLFSIIALVIPQTDVALTVKILRHWLGGKLPYYMLPAEYIVVSRFPMTDNGKIDRRQLSEYWRYSISVNKGGQCDQPNNFTEEKLRDIWQKILFRDDIGVHDDFFSLGGHSIKAILCASQIRKQFAVSLPVRSLFEAPTISQLAKLILEKNGSVNRFSDEQSPRLLPLHTAKNAEQVLYCLPPSIGTSTVYKEILMSMTRPLTAMGFQCGGFCENDHVSESLEDLAKSAALLIKEHYLSLEDQQHCAMLAYSFGGHLALEVAKILSADNICIPIVLIDVSLIKDVSAQNLSLEDLKEHPYWRSVISILQENLTTDEFEKVNRGVINNQKRLYEYINRDQPRDEKLKCPIVCIEATANNRAARMDLFSSKTSGSHKVLMTPGDHYSIFQPPNFSPFLNNLVYALDALIVSENQEVVEVVD